MDLQNCSENSVRVVCDIYDSQDCLTGGNRVRNTDLGTDGQWFTTDDQLTTNTYQLSTDYLFTGRRLDAESNLYYFRARMWDTAQGRFINRDPAGYVDGLNLYAGWFVSTGMDASGKLSCCKKQQPYYEAWYGGDWLGCVKDQLEEGAREAVDDLYNNQEAGDSLAEQVVDLSGNSIVAPGSSIASEMEGLTITTSAAAGAAALGYTGVANISFATLAYVGFRGIEGVMYSIAIRVAINRCNEIGCLNRDKVNPIQKVKRTTRSVFNPMRYLQNPVCVELYLDCPVGSFEWSGPWW